MSNVYTIPSIGRGAIPNRKDGPLSSVDCIRQSWGLFSRVTAATVTDEHPRRTDAL